MKNLFIATLAVVTLLAGTVQAQTTCTTIGNTVVCNGAGGRTTTCTQIGNVTVCN